MQSNIGWSTMVKREEVSKSFIEVRIDLTSYIEKLDNCKNRFIENGKKYSDYFENESNVLMENID